MRAALDLDRVADLRQPAELGQDVPGDRLVGARRAAPARWPR